MANRDGTGPNGKGPMTGRGLGNCSGRKTPIEANRMYRGRMRRLRNRGWR